MVRRITHFSSVAILLLGGGIGAAEPTVETVRLQDNIYMLQGPGGNIGLVIGDEATFLIDDKFQQTLPAVLDAVAELTDRPIDFVLNTHYHGDHTGANADLRDAGAWTVAHRNVRPRVISDPRQPDSAPPVITYDTAMSFFIDGVAVQIEHVASAHTDGDSVVFFEGVDVVHAGDTFFNGLYPYIDVDGGGGIDGMIAASALILERAGPDTQIIPGHGPLADRSDLETYLTMLRATRRAVAAALERGETADQMVAAGLLADFDHWTWGFIDTEKFTRSLVASLQAG
jgi:cyclase